ncbi:MAG: septum formation inhibitor Maf [Maribacter sp.]
MKYYRICTLGTLTFLLMVGLTSCKDANVQKDGNLAINEVSQTTDTPKRQLSTSFKEYWYAGNAEISSYTLEQGRYGELREGAAVLIYVTEPFLPEVQVKADQGDSNSIPVLKLNATKNYLTGIYPYSIMTSSFYPVHDHQHALKVAFSAQEWCGQVYAQLNNRNDFEIKSHSYFESEADQEVHINKTILENEIWNKIRIHPDGLPVGKLSIIPSMEFIRLSHKELKAYAATASKSSNETTTTYTISYPELERELAIQFSNAFPYTIEGWTDSFKGGFGQNAKMMTSTATLKKRIKTPYWQQNSNKDLYLRDSLGL